MSNMEYNPTIYSASKIWNNWRAIELRDKFDFNIIARWIDFDCGTKDNPTGAKVFTPTEKTVLWDGCSNDSTVCDMNVVYAEQKDEMRGALVEMGMTIGAGLALGIPKPVYVIGDCTSFQVAGHSDVAFMYHRWVHRIKTTQFPDGSYNHREGYSLARNHYLENYHPQKVFKETEFLHEGFTGGQSRFQQKATSNAIELLRAKETALYELD